MSERIALSLDLPAGALVVQAAPPLRVSQRTSLDVLGVPPRVYLESLAAYRARGGHVDALGKLRLVSPAEYLAWLGARAAVAPVDPIAQRVGELGLRAVAGGKR